MTVIYIDSVFVLNGLMDYVLLLSAARLAGVPLRRWRYAAAAVAGGAYAAAVFLPGCGFLAETPVKVAAGVLMALMAFGGEERLVRMTVLLFALACGMAGCVLGLGLLAGRAVPVVNGIFSTNVDGRELLLTAAGAYLVLSLVFRAAARHGVRGELLPVRVCLNGRTAALTALYDSGNGLREPGGRAVLVTAPGGLDGALPREVRALLSAESLKSPEELLEPLRDAAPWLRPRLTPYHAVGTSGGLLLTVRTDWTEIAGERFPGLTAALSPTALGTGYTALWGGSVGKGGSHGRFGNYTASVGPLGTAGGGRRSLHRGQRHSSAAPPERTGSGASGEHGRSSQAGAD